MADDEVWVTTSTCPASDCAGTIVPIGPYQGDPGAMPERMRCTEGHEFPVLERDTTSGGQTRYRLGPQSNAT